MHPQARAFWLLNHGVRCLVKGFTNSLSPRMDENTVGPLSRYHAPSVIPINLNTHDPNCVWSEGHHHWHAAFNDILHRALAAAHVTSRLAPLGSVVRQKGPCRMWNHCFTTKECQAPCMGYNLPDTSAPHYLANATSHAGTVAAVEEEQKKAKYISLDQTVPFFRTSGH